jgi:hypothetical protein
MQHRLLNEVIAAFMGIFMPTVAYLIPETQMCNFEMGKNQDS